MNELDPIARPEVFDADSWEALTPGERVRALRSAEDQVALPAETYRELRRLPSWAFFGPEHGLPPECFNQLGFLLPRYRPGEGSARSFSPGSGSTGCGGGSSIGCGRGGGSGGAW